MNVSSYLVRLHGDPVSECVLWDGAVNENGYGRMRHWYSSQDGFPVVAYSHRIAYWLFRGEFDQSLTLDHLCGVKLCCNPYHLEVVTVEVNTARGNTSRAFPMAREVEF